MAILEGSVYSCDLKDLAFVNQSAKKDGKPVLVLVYKQGAQVAIQVNDDQDRERQYNEIVKLWKKANP